MSATMNSKDYRVPVHSAGGLDNAPSVAVFSIDASTAREILKLSSLATANDLHKMEKFDYRARFLQYDPETDAEDADDAGPENEVRTECDVLVVEKDEFFFSAYVKHTDVKVSCEGRSIAELVGHFDLKQDDSAGTTGDERELMTALGKLVPHVLHYAAMTQASSTAHRDAADARAVIAKVQSKYVSRG